MEPQNRSLIWKRDLLASPFRYAPMVRRKPRDSRAIAVAGLGPRDAKNLGKHVGTDGSRLDGTNENFPTVFATCLGPSKGKRLPLPNRMRNQRPPRPAWGEPSVAPRSQQGPGTSPNGSTRTASRPRQPAQGQAIQRTGRQATTTTKPHSEQDCARPAGMPFQTAIYIGIWCGAGGWRTALVGTDVSGRVPAVQRWRTWDRRSASADFSCFVSHTYRSVAVDSLKGLFLAPLPSDPPPPLPQAPARREAPAHGTPPTAPRAKVKPGGAQEHMPGPREFQCSSRFGGWSPPLVDMCCV